MTTTTSQNAGTVTCLTMMRVVKIVRNVTHVKSNDVELAGDLPYIGRSTTTIPDNMTKEHIMKKFTYATTQTQTWSGHKCYYSIYESRGFMNYLGFKHNATGVIFSLYNTYSGKVGTTTVHLDGTKSEAYNWHAHSSRQIYYRRAWQMSKTTTNSLRKMDR